MVETTARTINLLKPFDQTEKTLYVAFKNPLNTGNIVVVNGTTINKHRPNQGFSFVFTSTDTLILLNNSFYIFPEQPTTLAAIPAKLSGGLEVFLNNSSHQVTVFVRNNTPNKFAVSTEEVTQPQYLYQPQRQLLPFITTPMQTALGYRCGTSLAACLMTTAKRINQTPGVEANVDYCLDGNNSVTYRVVMTHANGGY